MREKVKLNNLFETKRHCVAELVACRCVHCSLFTFPSVHIGFKAGKTFSRAFSEYFHRPNDVQMHSIVLNNANFLSVNVCKIRKFDSTRLKRTETSEEARNEYFLFSFLSCLSIDLYTKNF